MERMGTVNVKCNDETWNVMDFLLLPEVLSQRVALVNVERWNILSLYFKSEKHPTKSMLCHAF